MRKLFKERKLFKGGNYMRKYGILPLITRPKEKNFLSINHVSANSISWVLHVLEMC